MLDGIRRLFSRPQPNLSEEARAFIAKLAASEIWILAIGLRGTPAVPSATDPAAFDIIAAHRIDVGDLGDDDSVFPFNYDRDGRQILPFFTSEERAVRFRDDSGFDVDLSGFQPYCLRAGFVATPENELFDLVLDARSPDERRLTRDERLLLRSLSKPG
jgi:hypothetical protein